MRKENLQHHETLLLEVLLSALDARESAGACGSQMLIYLSDLMVARAKVDLAAVRSDIETLGEDAANGDAPA